MQNEINWKKIGIYLALLIGFLTVIFYIADIKERVAKLEVRIEHLQEKIR